MEHEISSTFKLPVSSAEMAPCSMCQLLKNTVKKYCRLALIKTHHFIWNPLHSPSGLAISFSLM